ncbi:Lrp/AsnC family transcriptional regulator [Candidatus Woesearchaeota archaeon]|nr:Lrp/AsnC family transcriptional regulator [Candidatus Woesearchaeota archaeon]
MKVDKKDRKLLHALDENSRLTYTQLGRIAGISQETARYRVEQLFKKGVIQQALTIVDPGKLHAVFYKVLLRFHNADTAKREEIVKRLISNPLLVWLAELDGSYDLGLVIKVEHVTELDAFMEGLYQQYHLFISKHDLSINLKGEYLLRDYLVHTSRKPQREISYSAEKGGVTLDALDLSILRALCRYPRIPVAALAKECDVAPDTIRNRMVRLLQNRVITKYTIVLNHDALNQLHCKILVYASDYDPTHISDFLHYCQSLSRVVYIIKALGKWNFELDIESESFDQFRDVMMDLTKRFSHVIRDYDTLIVRKIHKYNLYP